MSRGLEWVLGPEWRRGHPNVMRHFEMVAGWEVVKGVVGEGGFGFAEGKREIRDPNVKGEGEGEGEGGEG